MGLSGAGNESGGSGRRMRIYVNELLLSGLPLPSNFLGLSKQSEFRSVTND